MHLLKTIIWHVQHTYSSVESFVIRQTNKTGSGVSAEIMPGAVGLIQRERLAFIDFRLFFLGTVSRGDIVRRFGISPAVATRDLAQYRESAAANIVFDGKAKVYRISECFVPLFQHSLDRVFSALSKGFGDGLGCTPMNVCCEVPQALNRPDPKVVAAVSRSIATAQALSIKYVSVTSGETERVIVPHALADNGLRWHVRAFDRRTSSFRDFVLTRVSSPKNASRFSVLEGEAGEDDAEWNRILDLEIVAHPEGERPELAALDFGVEDGVLRMPVRAALAGYILQRLSVDCSADHSLDARSHPLWLRNGSVLDGCEGVKIIPGFKVGSRG